MKIGIITFHWGTNYGGVLQSFALQHFLSEAGAEVKMINFAPPTFRDSFLRCFISKQPKTVFNNIKTYIKDKNIDKFRNEYLNLTDRYYSIQELKQHNKDFDILISGSDQVWNPYGIKNYNLVYFLPFGKNKVKRISYAVSLGCENYPKDVMVQIKPLLAKFDAISVREKSALSILSNEGFNNVQLMPDPTLLLKKEVYLDLIASVKPKNKNYGFFYTLQPNQPTIKEIYNGINKKMSTINTLNIQSSTMGMKEWLSTFFHSEFVVTNSFHGIIFSLILNKNFIAVPIEGRLTGMNDRIYTLLNRFGLQNRILKSFDEKTVFELITKPIDWQNVQDVQNDLRKEAVCFFSKYMN